MSPQLLPNPRQCSVNDALEAVGDRYSLPLLREVLFGYRRFSELARLTGAPRTVLTTRLRKLEDAGVLERRQYCEKPARFEYYLTAAGIELFPVLLGLKDWGERHAGDQTVKALFRHRCGEELRPVLVCAACGQPALPGEFDVAGGTHPPVLRP